jgi:hypothetical protein
MCAGVHRLKLFSSHICSCESKMTQTR